MQSQPIDEPVGVRADFHGGVITPVMFRRKSRDHRVTRVNARWLDRAGRHPRLFFSVTDANGDVYQLQLQTGDMLWCSGRTPESATSSRHSCDFAPARSRRE